MWPNGQQVHFWSTTSSGSLKITQGLCAILERRNFPLFRLKCFIFSTNGWVFTHFSCFSLTKLFFPSSFLLFLHLPSCSSSPLVLPLVSCLIKLFHLSAFLALNKWVISTTLYLSRLSDWKRGVWLNNHWRNGTRVAFSLLVTLGTYCPPSLKPRGQKAPPWGGSAGEQGADETEIG